MVMGTLINKISNEKQQQDNHSTLEQSGKSRTIPESNQASGVHKAHNA